MTTETASGPALASAEEHSLVRAIYAGLRTAVFFEPNSEVMNGALVALHELLDGRISEQGYTLVGAHSQSLFVNGRRLRTRANDYVRLSYLVALFAEWSLESVAFDPTVTRSELALFLVHLARDRGRDLEGLKQVLADEGVDSIMLNPIIDSTGDITQAPRDLYATCMEVSRELRGTGDGGERVGMRRLRRVTQAVVDDVMRNPQALVALTTIKGFDDYLISHSTNVAILSVLLGQRLGLTKRQLGELCLAAFLHDAGKLQVAADVLNKPGPLSDTEREEVEAHPVLATNVLLKESRALPSIMRAVTVAFEHHLNYDLSGYPKVSRKKRVSLFGNIVMVADRYDAMTTPRIYRKRNLTPFEAMQDLVKQAGTRLDPYLVRLFVEIMGVYPPGTIVQLGSGRTALVFQGPRLGDPLDRPRVRVVLDDTSSEVIDLAAKNPDGSYSDSITMVMNPANRGMLPAVDVSALWEQTA